MLKRIYIDNFRGLVNFEMSFDSINLFLGGNGSGKSTVFEALRKVQTFVIRFFEKYYGFNELSDGQKTLIALYTLIYCTQDEDYTLCIHEPENFLALPEIQPWLIELYDFCADKKLQALLISHHPELINYLLASPIGYWFERQSNSPARVRKITNEESDHSGLPISELIARGWLHEF
ncbi:MAG: AAA family ATPase [Dolichospermum sp.]|jgi:predicted ATPase|uniref:AAA family ATPase n=1 Tax=Dolichospermum circinale CS-537/01 TaxID=3021739 RepID=A0ABT5AA88_9CYAN|nr:AAA family ATPase [Dolichospermum circinale]MCE2717734.1 ATP-binding protein [Anabaena sp. 49628_E55]MDB9488890.1 AAA family ATPase [Dolichospermum circinale CS-537/01]